MPNGRKHRILTCSRCNGDNHLARDCLAPRDDSAKKCYKCSETGHIARYVNVSKRHTDCSDCPANNDTLPAE